MFPDTFKKKNIKKRLVKGVFWEDQVCSDCQCSSFFYDDFFLDHLT